MKESCGRYVDTSRGGDNSTLDFRELEPSIFFRNDDIAVEDHLGPPTKCTAIHRCDDRFVEGVSSRDRSETMGHGGQFFLIIGDLGAETGVVSFKPTRERWDWRGCDSRSRILLT